ncbi:MAG: hypothetical protein HKP61_04625 [Dactylosporangium sp.]|nr:hypothetical protein [Dactylosporangium sp.]NNJ60231.1 hypothetical protein [Dactylosporangium sp.]
MPTAGAVAALAATCHRVAGTLPMEAVALAKERTGEALAALTAAGTSGHPRFLAAREELTALCDDLDLVLSDLTTAAEQVRIFREQLG